MLCLFKKLVFHLHRCQSHSGHFTKMPAVHTHSTARTTTHGGEKIYKNAQILYKVHL